MSLLLTLPIFCVCDSPVPAGPKPEGWRLGVGSRQTSVSSTLAQSHQIFFLRFFLFNAWSIALVPEEARADAAGAVAALSGVRLQTLCDSHTEGHTCGGRRSLCLSALLGGSCVQMY